MTLQLLLELLDTTSVDSADVKGSKSSINRIAQMLFRQDAGPVKDLKRSKEAKFFGVADARSVFIGPNGKGVRLTFDNSTDSGEFEINSLVPLGITKGSEEDKAIKQLYKDLEIESKKRTNYIISGDQTLLREIHLGKVITHDTVKMVRAITKMLRKEEPEEKKDEEPAPKREKEPEEKPAKKVEKPAPKKVEKPEPKLVMKAEKKPAETVKFSPKKVEKDEL
jgi:hypothetical protein